MDEKLGPVAVSIKREKLEDHKEHGPQYQYRIIFRTREVGLSLSLSMSQPFLCPGSVGRRFPFCSPPNNLLQAILLAPHFTEGKTETQRNETIPMGSAGQRPGQN